MLYKNGNIIIHLSIDPTKVTKQFSNVFVFIEIKSIT